MGQDSQLTALGLGLSRRVRFGPLPISATQALSLDEEKVAWGGMGKGKPAPPPFPFLWGNPSRGGPPGVQIHWQDGQRCASSQAGPLFRTATAGRGLWG